MMIQDSPRICSWMLFFTDRKERPAKCLEGDENGKSESVPLDSDTVL